LLFGTTTWAQAMKTIWQGLAVKIIEHIEDMIVELLLWKAVQASLNIFTGGLFGGVSKLFGFAEGTPYVPQTQLAVVHQGEMIIPADQAAAIRGGEAGIGGGGSSINITNQITAWDGASVASWLRGQGGQMLARQPISAAASGSDGVVPDLGQICPTS